MSDQGIRGERLQVMLSDEELAALDDFRFRERMPSRAAAVRELLKRGLAAEGYGAAIAGAKSSEFGVIGGGRPLTATPEDFHPRPLTCLIQRKGLQLKLR